MYVPAAGAWRPGGGGNTAELWSACPSIVMQAIARPLKGLTCARSVNDYDAACSWTNEFNDCLHAKRISLGG